VTAEGCVMGISLVRCISSTSGRSFTRLLAGVRVKELELCNNRASGRVERSPSSTSIPFEDMDDDEEAEDLLRRFAGLSDGSAHSGTGLSR
jgi:hypothetical protein